MLGATLVGFVAGPALDIDAWTVALAAIAVLVAVTGRPPWRHVPYSTAATVARLGDAMVVSPYVVAELDYLVDHR